MTEQTKPELLDESALQEIEAINQRCRYPYVDALCQTVRALRGQYESAISDFAVEINALREQLTEASKNLRIRRGWQQHVQRMATILDCEALDIRVEHAASELQSRLAQVEARLTTITENKELQTRLAHVEKERDDLQLVIVDVAEHQDWEAPVTAKQKLRAITGDAATRMRERCVARVGQVWENHLVSNNEHYEKGFNAALKCAQIAIRSLTLDGEK